MQLLLLPLLLLVNQGVAQFYYEVKGYIKPELISNDAELTLVESFLKTEIKERDFFLLRTDYNELNNGLKTFLAFIESDTATYLDKYSANEKFSIVFSRRIDIKPTPPVIRPTVGCLNGGTPLNNGTCACGPFTSGNMCQTVRCQRMGILEDNQSCYCPPGWYAQFCEIRGCRPPLVDNLDVSQSSFMLVLPVTPSMQNIRTTLQNNLKNTLYGMNNGWFGSYVLNMVVQVDAKNFVHYITVANSINQFMTNLGNTTIVPINQPNTYPIMQSIFDIQQYQRVYSHSIIMVFTDSPDRDAGPVSYTFADGTPELLATQATMIWKNRAFIFFVKNSSINVNTTLDSYDTYRRMVTYSHGDLFVINSNEVQTVIQNVLPKLSRPEYLDVRSFAQCGDLVLNIPNGEKNQPVILVTVDYTPSTPSNLTITATDTLFGTTTIEPVARGPLWAVFTVDYEWQQIRINVSPNATCSAKVFVESKETLLWSYTDDNLIDVGNCMNVAELNMQLTLQPINFELLSQFQVEFTNHATGNPFTQPMAAQVRAEQDCTYIYRVPALPSCAAGPYTQKFTFTTSTGTSLTRIHPGFCSHEAKSNGTEAYPPQFPTPGNATGNTCYTLNAADMGGKLHDFRQVIFVTEMAAEMQSTLNNLNGSMASIISGIAQDSVKRQFTWVIFDSAAWTAVVSDYDPNLFVDKFRIYYQSRYMNNLLPASNGAFSMDAIYEAINLEIISPAIIHVFTMSAPKSSNFYRVLPTDVQVNFFYISSSGEIPQYNDFRTMQKQTGGRLISLTSGDLDTSFFVESINKNNLVLDAGYQDCGAGMKTQFQVEKAASALEITILGNIDKGVITLTDGNSSTVSTTSKAVIVMNSNKSLVTQYDLTAGKLAAGLWSVTVMSVGSCYVQVRATSAVNVAVGFTSDVHSDFPAHHPFNRRGTNDSTYAVVRTTSGTVNQLIVQPTDFNQPWNSNLASNGSILLNSLANYDGNSCAYQFRSGLFAMPLTSSVKVTVTGTDSAGSAFQRIFNYYTPEDYGQKCNGGNVNAYGECACDSTHTGEYCQERICAYGSTPSRGICQCYSFFHGDQCEKIQTDWSTATEPAAPPTTAIPLQTTTSGSVIGIAINFIFVITFMLFKF